jgi:hypothetical protein
MKMADKVIDNNEEEEEKLEEIDNVNEIPEPLESASQVKPS